MGPRSAILEYRTLPAERGPIVVMKDREKARLVADLERQGARIKPTKSGWLVFYGDGPGVAIHRSPSSDGNGDKLVRSRIERTGLRWPERGV